MNKNDPVANIRDAAINPSCASNQQQQEEIENLKKQGLCIRCGIERTHHVKKKKGVFNIRGGSATQLKPLGDEPCYKEHLCPKCFRIKISGGGSSTTLRVSSSSSPSIQGRVGGSGSVGGDHARTRDNISIGTNHTATGGGSSVMSPTSPGNVSYISHTSQGSRYTNTTFGGGYYSNNSSNLGSSSRNNNRPHQRNNSDNRRERGTYNRNSQCVRISVLPKSVWNGRMEENTMQESRESMIFPKYESTKASRTALFSVFDSFDCSKKEYMYVVSINQNGRPKIAYRKLSYPPPIEINQNCRWIHCLRLERDDTRGMGFQEPLPKEKWSCTVMIKEIKKQSYFGYDGKNDSPFKDAVVLQQIGDDRYDGILSCDEILEDDHYIYVVCPMLHPKPLCEFAVHHPKIRNPQTYNQIQEEQYIKYIFKQLVKSVSEAHMHGLCHRNLDPQKIYALQQQQQQSSLPSARSTTSTNVVLSDFTTSVMLTSSDDYKKRYLFVPARIGGSNHRYIAPEVYYSRVYDGISADVWSLGVILFELLTGCHLHSQPTRMDPIYCYFVLQSGFLQASQGTIPDEIWRMLSSSDSDRSMIDLMDRIEAINQLSQNARNLLTDLLQESPPNRLSIEEVLHHPWFFRTG